MLTSHTNRIDRFSGAAQVRDELLARVRWIDGFLAKLDGCLDHGILEQPTPGGTFDIVTFVRWESRESMAAARQTAAAEYRRQGFDPHDFLARLGITAQFGSYSAIA